MKKKLETLEQLQDIDQLINILKNSQKGLNDELSDISQAVHLVREEVAAMEIRLAQLEKEKADLEENHATELANICRSETNMKEIKTNKEFQAVGREISAARKQVADLEEQMLLKISQIEELAGEVAVRKASLGELVENSANRAAEKQAEIDKIQLDIDSDTVRRDILTKEMPAALVKRYTTLRDQRRGQALAIARDGYCLGCNMHLPPQLYNNLFKHEELLACPHCQRMLVLKLQQ
ncbi:MAG: C4-type zinc ribbon domain-containing protein [Desulfuromonadaceae bacterium]|nr:C4-type zinc ribbon domain-containing protein [Desulfuromonadaceae bacterium]